MCSGIVWAWLGVWLFSEQRGVWESTGACKDIEAGKGICRAFGKATLNKARSLRTLENYEHVRGHLPARKKIQRFIACNCAVSHHNTIFQSQASHYHQRIQPNTSFRIGSPTANHSKIQPSQAIVTLVPFHRLHSRLTTPPTAAT